MMAVTQAPIPEQVIEDIQTERLYQIEGGRGWTYDSDDTSTINDWAAYIQIYLGRAVQTSEARDLNQAENEFRKNMVKVATLAAAAAIEAVDRGRTPARHYSVSPQRIHGDLLEA